tara:strand:- start:610 stop:960 length:351 start_codon:yes stop_codon:yes gene_type:complete
MVIKFIKKKFGKGSKPKPKPKKPKPKPKTKKKAAKLTAAERAERKEARAVLQSLPPGVRNSMRKAMADRKAAGKLSDQQLKKAAKKKAEERMNKLTGQMLYGSLRSNTFKRGGRAR